MFCPCHAAEPRHVEASSKPSTYVRPRIPFRRRAIVDIRQSLCQSLVAFLCLVRSQLPHRRLRLENNMICREKLRQPTFPQELAILLLPFINGCDFPGSSRAGFNPHLTPLLLTLFSVYDVLFIKMQKITQRRCDFFYRTK